MLAIIVAAALVGLPLVVAVAMLLLLHARPNESLSDAGRALTSGLSWLRWWKWGS